MLFCSGSCWLKMLIVKISGTFLSVTRICFVLTNGPPCRFRIWSLPLCHAFTFERSLVMEIILSLSQWLCQQVMPFCVEGTCMQVFLHQEKAKLMHLHTPCSENKAEGGKFKRWMKNKLDKWKSKEDFAKLKLSCGVCHLETQLHGQLQ